MTWLSLKNIFKTRLTFKKAKTTQVAGAIIALTPMEANMKKKWMILFPLDLWVRLHNPKTSKNAM